MRTTDLQTFTLSPRRGLAVAAIGLAAAVVAAAALLWLHYGTAVFYEMILAGLAGCL